MPKDVLRVAIKLPAKVQSLDKAIARLGGVSHLANTICKVHQKVSKAQLTLAKQNNSGEPAKEGQKRERTHFISHQLQKQAKNLVRFKLTDSVEVPLETKKTNQVLLKITKLQNVRTGKIAYQVHKVKAVDYEFEAEALADFAFVPD